MIPVPLQPNTPGAGSGGAANYVGAAASLLGGGGLGAAAGLAGGGGGNSVSDRRDQTASLKSDNKNRLSANLDLSGNAGQRGASFNFGTNVSPTIGAGGGGSTVIWIAIAAAGALVVGLFLWRKK